MTTVVRNTKTTQDAPVESGENAPETRENAEISDFPQKVAFVPDIPATKAEMERARVRVRQTVKDLMAEHGYEDVTQLLQFFARDEERENNPHQAGDDCPVCGGNAYLDNPTNPYAPGILCADCMGTGILTAEDAESLNEQVRLRRKRHAETLKTNRAHTALWLRIGERTVR